MSKTSSIFLQCVCGDRMTAYIIEVPTWGSARDTLYRRVIRIELRHYMRKYAIIFIKNQYVWTPNHNDIRSNGYLNQPIPFFFFYDFFLLTWWVRKSDKEKTWTTFSQTCLVYILMVMWFFGVSDRGNLFKHWGNCG